MALRISAAQARYQLMQYAGYVQEVMDEAGANFTDMDFENSNRRDDMEEIIQKMQKDCQAIITEMEGIYFEE